MSLLTIVFHNKITYNAVFAIDGKIITINYFIVIYSLTSCIKIMLLNFFSIQAAGQ